MISRSTYQDEFFLEMNPLFPQGGLLPSNIIYFSCIYQGEKYTLCSDVDYNLIMKKSFLGTTVNPDVESEILPLILNTSNSNIILSNYSDGELRYIYYDVNDLLILTSDINQITTFTQNTYTGLGPPIILMSGVPYEINAKVVIENVLDPQDIKLIPLPSSIYISSNVPTADLYDILKMDAGWVNVNDYRTGIVYDYCLTGVTCSGNCVSTCSSTSEVCSYTGNNYSCLSGVNSNVPKIENFERLETVSILDQTWFIIIAVIAIIIILMVILYISQRHVRMNNIIIL